MSKDSTRWVRLSWGINIVLLLSLSGVMRSLLDGISGCGFSAEGPVLAFLFLVAVVILAVSSVSMFMAVPVGVFLVLGGRSDETARGEVNGKRGSNLRRISGGLNILLFAAFAVMWVRFALPAIGRGPVRSQAPCINNLRQIDAAKEQARFELGWTNGQHVANGDERVNAYIKGLAGTTNTPECPDGGAYTYNFIGRNPTCSAGMWDGKPRRKKHVWLFWWDDEVDFSLHVLVEP